MPLYYFIANNFNMTKLGILSFSLIERCFTMLADSQSFLELDYSLVAKILLSSSLHITTEIEVFNVADLWLSQNIEKRKKFAKDLLL